MTDAPSPAGPAPKNSRLGLPAALLGSVIAVVLLGVFALWRCEKAVTKAAAQPGEIASNVAKAFQDILHVQPQVTVNERVVLNQSHGVLELAVLSRDVEVEREFEHTWLGSTKKIRLRGTYRVKTGFDLTQPFSVELSDAPGTPARVTLPMPKVLSVDPVHVEVLALENGLWNKIQPENLESEIDMMPDEARRKAQRNGMVREAEESIVKQLSTRFPTPPGVTVKVVPPVPPGWRKE